MDQLPEAHRILIVEDDPSMREALGALLATRGYRTEEVASGADALGRARQDPPDLILLDVGLPDMDGYEVCRHLKADARTAGAPILMVTGLSDSRDMERGVASGADDFVSKPVGSADLLARVHSLLRVRHLSQEVGRTLAYMQELEAARRAAGPGGRGAGGLLPPRKAGAAHVLLVDDERLVRQMSGDLLAEAGYRVTAVGSAAEAFAAAGGDVDVILLDIVMPEVSGLEALERFHQIAPDVPVIIYTAYQTAQNAIAALRGGAFDFIVKGMKKEMLLNAVTRAVERRRLMLENRRLLEELRAKQTRA